MTKVPPAVKKRQGTEIHSSLQLHPAQLFLFLLQHYNSRIMKLRHLHRHLFKREINSCVCGFVTLVPEVNSLHVSQALAVCNNDPFPFHEGVEFL